MITYSTVPDPDLEISMGGEGSSRPLDIKGGEQVSKKKHFRPFGPQLGLKIILCFICNTVTCGMSPVPKVFGHFTSQTLA